MLDLSRPRRAARAPARLAAILALALLVGVGACGSGDEAGGGGEEAAAEDDGALRGAVVEPAPEVGDLALPDEAAGGEAFPLVAEEGGLLLVYFGYTSCPDVCPLSMSDVQLARDELLEPEEAERVDLAMITVDPARDTGDVLTQYVQTFVPEGHALRTEDDAALAAVAEPFGASYEVTGSGPDTEVGHSAALYAVDDEGTVLVQWPFGTAPEDIAHDLQTLLADQEEP